MPEPVAPIHAGGSAVLRPRARLISLIGEELISDEPVAVVELVKNAYDADARKVTVKFSESNGQVDGLVVQDDGVGMDLDTVLGAWFEPGTVAKRSVLTSPGGRPLQGAKGIGRFASSRLATTLQMETRTKKSSNGVYALIEWGRFDDDSYLDEISLDYEERPVGELLGTRLTMEGLRKPWTRRDFEDLHARLSRLISPFDEVHEFAIDLMIPGAPDLSGIIGPPDILLRPKYELRGDVDAEGRFDGDIRIDGHLQTSYPRWAIRSRAGVPLSGPFGVEIRAWDRDREGLLPFAESLSKSITEIRRTLDSYCGVSIYRNGFRVHPYGEKGNDWLNLDLRSRLNPVIRLANNQVIAAIKISRESNAELRDRSTREGMVFNPAHRDLEEWFKEILALLEAERYKVRPRRSDTAETEPMFEAFDISSSVEQAKSELGANHPITLLIASDERQLRVGVERIQDAFSRMLMAAGLGQMVDVVLHEIGSPLGKINRKLVVLERDLEGRLAQSDRKHLAPMLTDIKAWLEQIQGLRQRLEPQTAGRRTRSTLFAVDDEIQDSLDLYEALLQRQGIKANVTVEGSPLSVTMPRAVLGQVAANLIDNSIFWITRQRGGAKGGRISIQAGPIDGGFKVRFSDDGPGIPRADRERIFEPYFTNKPNGIGLGLYICRFLIEPYGRLTIEDDCALGGACFEVSFERGVGR